MSKIIPHLWFDHQAEQAADFYCEIFDNSKVKRETHYLTETPSEKTIGSVMSVDFQIEGQQFLALNGGPAFDLNPSISFIVHCGSEAKIDRLWQGLVDEGKVLMPLDRYPFSDRFGWVEDKYGVSWQLQLSNPSEFDQVIVPKIMFVGESCGKAEEAVNHFTSVFRDSKVEGISKYGEMPGPNDPDHVRQASFALDGYWFAAMDSGFDHKFSFNESISFMRLCRGQDEIDYFWDNLSADPTSGQCGWLKDRYGISWQIVPVDLIEMLNQSNREKAEKVMRALLEMKKIDVDALRSAFNS